MSLLAYALLGVLSLNDGRDEFHCLWDAVDTERHPTTFEEVEAALKELQDAGHVERVPGWHLEYRMRQQAA